MMKRKKFKVETLGCRTNQYESQAYKDQLEGLGFDEAGEEGADLCIVNTCTVTESADKKSFLKIRQLLKKNPDAKVMVTGCLAKREKEQLMGLSSRIEIVGNEDKERLLEFALPDLEAYPEFSIRNFSAHTRAFVKIQDGCNSYCSYCIIPYVRGRSHSKDPELILREVRALVANGYKEIVLTGINIGDFTGPMTLAELVVAIDKIEGVKRLRLSSIDPDEVDDALLEAIVNGKHTCPSMHIVLQSGSNSVLKRMRRKYTREDFFETIYRLKRASPTFTFTTDLIVGFPGETEEDFHESLNIIEEVKFAKVHMFPYSDRPKTRASRMEDKVDAALMERRRQEVLRLSERVAFDLREGFLGQEMDVLIEEVPGGVARGHTENFLDVTLLEKGHHSNELVRVKLLKNEPHGFLGKTL